MEKCEEQLWWAQPCSNIPSKQEERDSELNPQAVSPVPAVGQTPVSPVSFFTPCMGSPWAGRWNPHCPLTSQGGCKVTLRETGSVKDFIGSGLFLTGLHKCVFKTEAPLPLYFIYILWGSRWMANSDCYKKRSSMIWSKFTWHLLSQLRPAIPTWLCCFCNSLVKEHCM